MIIHFIRFNVPSISKTFRLRLLASCKPEIESNGESYEALSLYQEQKKKYLSPSSPSPSSSCASSIRFVSFVIEQNVFLDRFLCRRTRKIAILFLKKKVFASSLKHKKLHWQEFFMRKCAHFRSRAKQETNGTRRTRVEILVQKRGFFLPSHARACYFLSLKRSLLPLLLRRRRVR